MNASKLATFIIFLTYSIFGLSFFLLLGSEYYSINEYAYRFLPFDGLTYIELSETIDFELVNIDALNAVKGKYNWLTLPWLYSILSETVSEYSSYFIVIINSFIIASSFYIFSKGLTPLNISPLYSLWIFICTQLYLFPYVLVPNKDIPLLLVVSLSVYFLGKNKALIAGLFILFGAALKFQLALAFVFLLAQRKKWRLFLVGMFVLALIYPLLMSLGFIIGMVDFLDIASGNVATANLMLLLEKIASYPLGFLVVSPIRIGLNIIAGLFTLPKMFSSDFISFASSLTNAFLALLSIKIIYYLIKKPSFVINHIFNNYGFLVAYVVVLSLIPFMQTRYYWFLIPFFIKIYFELKEHGNHELGVEYAR